MNERSNKRANGFGVPPIERDPALEFPERVPKPTRPDPGLTEKTGGIPPGYGYTTPAPWWRRVLG